MEILLTGTQVITGVIRAATWTPQLVEIYLAEAAETLGRLPGTQVCRHTMRWPDSQRVPDGFDQSVQGRSPGGPPSAAAIDRMDTTLDWLHWLEPDDRRLVWERACGVPWKILAYRHGMTRTTAWRHWVAALLTISQRLGTGRTNKTADATLFDATNHRPTC